MLNHADPARKRPFIVRPRRNRRSPDRNRQSAKTGTVESAGMTMACAVGVLAQLKGARQVANQVYP